MPKEKKLYNPRCLVWFLHWEVTGKILKCEKCPLADRCREYQAAKVFRETS